VADLEKLKTQVALLEKDAESGALIHQRLEIAIEKLTDITISLKGMLVQQETKLAKAEETDNDIFITLESRRKSGIMTSKNYTQESQQTVENSENIKFNQRVNVE